MTEYEKETTSNEEQIRDLKEEIVFLTGRVKRLEREKDNLSNELNKYKKGRI